MSSSLLSSTTTTTSSSRTSITSIQPFTFQSILLGLSIATLLVIRGLYKKSLSKSGSIAGFIIGFLSISCGSRGLLVIVFYQVGSWATKYKKEIKQRIDGNANEESQRDATQVLGCSLIAVICSLVHVYYCGQERFIDFEEYKLASELTCCIVAHYSACLGDTLASEFGTVMNMNFLFSTTTTTTVDNNNNSNNPRLILPPFQHVPRGTNGGITWSGTIWSGLGGGIIGISCFIIDYYFVLQPTPTPLLMMEEMVLKMILFGIICGLLGSVVDSILGASLQASYYDDEKKMVYSGHGCCSCCCWAVAASGDIKNKSSSSSSLSDNRRRRLICGRDILSNVQVNVISVLFTTLIGGFVIAPQIFY